MRMSTRRAWGCARPRTVLTAALALLPAVGLAGVGLAGVGLAGLGLAGLGLADSGPAQAAQVVRPAAQGIRPAVKAGVISTVAGGVGGPATATSVALDNPCGVSYASGHAYVADGYDARVLNTATDGLTTPVGTGLYGPLGIGGLAVNSAGLGTCSTAADSAGNIVIAVPSPSHILVAAQAAGTFYGHAMTAGHLYNVAGNGTEGFSGDGHPATTAKLNEPGGVAVDGAGNLLIADTSNSRIRVVAATTGTFYGQAMTAGDIYLLAGNGQDGYAGNGGPAAKAKLDNPYGVAVDGAGNVLIPDTISNRIRVVAATTGSFYGIAMTAGDIYSVAGNGTGGFAGDGGPAAQAELQDPTAVSVDGAGNLVIADTDNGRIRVLAASAGTFYGQPMKAGDIYTVAGNGSGQYSGDGGPATSAGLYAPGGVAVDGAGNLLIADKQSGRIRVVAASAGTFYGEPMKAGDIYTVAGNGNFQYSGDGGPAPAAELNVPDGVSVDSAGDVLIADTSNERIRMTAAKTGTFFAIAMTAGDTYTVAGVGINGFTGDGGPATSAWVSNPNGVASDSAGNLLIADSGNHRIRLVAAKAGTFYGQVMKAGDIYTIAGDGTFGFTGDGGAATAAELSSPRDVQLDGSGNLLITDTYNDRIRVVAAKAGTFYGQVMKAGDIYTIAGDGSLGYSGDGGPATSAGLCEPYGAVADAAGNVLIADYCSNRVRVVAATTATFYGVPMTAGDIYTIAGGGPGGLGDGGPGTAAAVNLATGVAVDSAGNVLISDYGDSRVRVLAAKSGTFYGQPMTAGDIYTVAGSGAGTTGALGTAGFTGDGGPGTKAEVNSPMQVAPDGTAGLVFADSQNNRIRMVA
jgi:trimeric autotransporter adhesin